MTWIYERKAYLGGEDPGEDFARELETEETKGVKRGDCAILLP